MIHDCYRRILLALTHVTNVIVVRFLLLFFVFFWLMLYLVRSCVLAVSGALSANFGRLMECIPLVLGMRVGVRRIPRIDRCARGGQGTRR